MRRFPQRAFSHFSVQLYSILGQGRNKRVAAGKFRWGTSLAQIRMHLRLAMDGRDIIVIGTSTGGLAALRELVRELPRDLPAAVFIVQHIDPLTPSVLPALLAQSGQLEVAHAMDNEEIRNSRVYVAPPDNHLMIADGRVRLSQGPKENLTRPAIDPLFRSAALAFGGRVVGVLLTGELDDGTAGLWSIKDRGGITVVQDPREAEYPSMPQSAVKHVPIDYCLPLGEIGPLLVRLANEPAPKEKSETTAENLELENTIALNALEAFRLVEKLGKLTPFTCPDCHGSLWELRQGSVLRFRCRTGHAYTAESLIAEQRLTIEKLLKEAMRATEENPTLCRYLSEHARDYSDHLAADHFLYQTAENERRAHLILQLLHDHEKTSDHHTPGSLAGDLARKRRTALIELT